MNRITLSVAAQQHDRCEWSVAPPQTRMVFMLTATASLIMARSSSGVSSERKTLLGMTLDPANTMPRCFLGSGWCLPNLR